MHCRIKHFVAISSASNSIFTGLHVNGQLSYSATMVMLLILLKNCSQPMLILDNRSIMFSLSQTMLF